MFFAYNTELFEFRTIVDELAQAKTGELYVNSGVNHAKVVVSKLLSSATESADICASSLDARVHDKAVYKHLIDTVGAGKVRIVLTANKGEKNNELVKMLDDHGVEIRQVNDIASHLIVVDGDSFRVETDVEEMKAVFAFGGDRSKRFQIIFNNIWEHALDIAPSKEAV